MWESLSDLKESHPMQVAECATMNGINNMPAFAWWVPHVLKKCDQIMSAVNERHRSRTHKFGIKIPKTVKHALEIDKENGNALLADAIAKEMTNVQIAFKVLNDDKKAPIGYQCMDCHMIFDCKMESNFRRKARLVAGGHMTKSPKVPTHASVVSCNAVCIALTQTALNDLKVKGSNIQNAFLAAPCEEKIFTMLGEEFGPNEGKRAIEVWASCGLKSARASFNRHLADCMRNLGFVACKADTDLWMKLEQ